MRKFFILIVLLITVNYLFAQNGYRDQLSQNANDDKIPSAQRLSSYQSLIELLRSEQEFDKAISESNNYLNLAKKEKNLLEETKANVSLAIINLNQEKFNKAEVYINLSDKISKNSDNPLAVAYAFYAKAYQENSSNNSKSAMSYALKSLSSLEKANGDFDLEFKLNYMLYGIYTDWNDERNTMIYAKKAFESAEKSRNKNNLSNAYSALAVACSFQYEKSKSAKDLDLVLENIEKAAVLYQEFSGQVAGFTYALARNNKASYLLRYYPKRSAEIRKQINYNLNESIKISKSLPNSQSIQASSYGMLSELAKQDGNSFQAEQYLLEAYRIILTEKPIYFPIAIRIAEELSAVSESKGNFKEALDYQKKVGEYKNELFNQQEVEATKKLEAQYQSIKKEKELQFLKERASNRDKQRLLYAGLALIGLIGIFFMFRTYHFKLRYSISREKQLAEQKNKAELQVKLEKEEQIRLRTEQQLSALQQQKLQDEVMANQLHIQHKNEVLQQLKERLDDDSSLNIKQIIREENLLDNDFEKAQFQIQEIHPNFFKNLNDKSKQKLTSLDLKYCAYFYLGLDTKQIANLLHVEPKSVRMTKYRLKQKFELDAETDLVNYLKER